MLLFYICVHCPVTPSPCLCHLYQQSCYSITMFMSSILIVLLLHHHVYVIYTNSPVTPSPCLCHLYQQSCYSITMFMSSIPIVLLLHHHVYVIYTNSLVTPSLVLCVICFVDCCLTLLGVTDSDCSFGYLLSIVLSLPLGSYRFRLLLWVSFVHCVVSPCLSYRF